MFGQPLADFSVSAPVMTKVPSSSKGSGSVTRYQTYPAPCSCPHKKTQLIIPAGRSVGAESCDIEIRLGDGQGKGLTLGRS